MAAQSPPWTPVEAKSAKSVRAIAEARARANPKGAFEELSPHVGDDPRIAEGVLGGVDAASRPPGYSRFGANEDQKLPVDPRWTDIAVRFLGAKKEYAVEAAALVLLSIPPRAEWEGPLRTARVLLEKKHVYTAPVDELLEKIAGLGAGAARAEPPSASKKPSKTAAPLPPERRGRAPKPVVPKSVPVAKLGTQIDRMLAKAGLEKHRATLVQPALHVLTRRVEEQTLALGASKIGGLPDLPPRTKWPENDGHALGFVAQLRLEEIAKLGEKRLPKKGLLLFFVDDEAFGDGYLTKAKVLHVTDTKKLVRTEPPASMQACRAGHPARQPAVACAVTFVPTLTVPSPSNPVVTKHLDERAAAKYEEHVQLEQEVLSQVLGFRKHDYDAENPESAQLLLRVTSDPQADTSWGDDDCLDFYVPKKELAKGSFAKVYPYVGD